MHKFVRYLAVSTAITIVFLANTVNAAFHPIPLKEIQITPEFSSEKDSAPYPTQSKNSFYPVSEEMKNQKPESSFLDFWDSSVFARDEFFGETKGCREFAYVDEDSMELVIGVNKGYPNAYNNLVNAVSGTGGKVVNTVSIKGEVIALVVDMPLIAISSFVKDVQTGSLARYVEPNMKFKAQFVPNDPNWTLQWGPQKIEADWAWNTTTGDPSILVAVIDTGIDYTHPDLADNYVTLGLDWIEDDGDPLDDNGHGTHCAGIIAAILNNNEGIAGLAQVQIMAEKGLDAGGWGSEDDLANAIIHAVDQGANILSNSWGDYFDSVLIHDAIRYAHENGVLVVAAAGNSQTSDKLYPAAYDEVVAVTAADSYDYPAWFTNFGDWVEVAAPGVNIYSTMPTYNVTLNNPPYNENLNYDYLSGTSMACPHVAGIAALIWSQFPNATRDWVRAQLRYTADDLGDSGFDEYYGYGRINARRAVEQAPPDHDLLILGWDRPLSAKPRTSIIFNTTVLNYGTDNESGIVLRLLVNDALIDSANIAFLEAGTSVTVTTSWNAISEGIHNVTTYIVPVSGETNIANNFASAMISVRYVLAALISDNYQLLGVTSILDSIGVGYDAYNENWMRLYTENLGLLLNYSTVIFYNSDRLITSDEHSALESFLSAGGNLLVTGYDSLGSPDDSLLADIVRSSSTGDYVGKPALYVRNSTHPIMDGPFGSFPEGYYIYDLFGDCDMAKADTTRGAITVAALDYYYDRIYDKIIATETAGGKVVYWNGDGTYDWTGNADCEIMFKNVLVWFMADLFEHELLVTIEAPDFLVPDYSALLNATVYNIGLNNEANVELQLLINSTLVNNVTIPELSSGESYTIDYLWTPSVEGTYDITAYAPLVLGENITINNRITKFVKATYPLINPIEGQYANYTLHYYDSTGYLFGIGYWNLTYDHYVEPFKIYITLQYKDPSGYTGTSWMIVNTIDRFVESGAWAGMWYPGWIETDIGIGSTINLLYGPATVTGSKMMLVGPRAIDSWELPYSMYEYSYTFWYDKISGLWIDMEAIDPSGMRMELLLAETNVPIGTQYEHDLGVTLDIPEHLQPGETALLKATVYNLGLNNEADVDIYLLINDTEVASGTRDLANSAWYTINYSWTPTVEGIYNVTAYAPPVLDETVTVNNIVSKMVYVRYIEVALISDFNELMYVTPILDSMGIGYDIYNNNYMNLYTEDLDLLLNYKAVVFFKDGRWITSVEYSTLESYLSLGGNLLVTGYNCLISDNLMADIVRSSSTGDNWGEYDLWVVDATHPIMDGPFGSFPEGYHIYGLYGDCDMAEANIAQNAVTVAKLTDEYDKIIATDGLPGKVVCWNGVGTYDWALSSDCGIMFKNIMYWFTVRYQHELVVSLETLKFVEPGDSTLLNATVHNQGINDETDVELQLLINSTVVKTETIPLLINGTSHTLSHLWTPTFAGTYNLTVYAPPVPEENVTRNNVYSRLIPVQYAPKILAYLQYADYYQEYQNTLRAIESKFGPNYNVTEMWDFTQLDSMIQRKDILLIPEQEYASLSTMQMIGASWSETLSEFLENGGTIIVCDFMWGSGGTYGILTGAGLMQILRANERSWSPLYLVDPTDSLARGVSSSFMAPYGTISFVTGETNIVVNDGTNPVVIHKKIDRGHIALLGFDFASSNADVDQILGNAVALAAYIPISTSLSAGSPGTEVTVKGIKATANGTVSIYWDATLMGNTTATNLGDFVYILTLPENATIGTHEITAVDMATGRTGSTIFRVILITLNPVKGPVGTKVTVHGFGFLAESQATITFNDMEIGYARVDEFGNFTFTLNIPLSTAETQIIKALDAEANSAFAAFTVVDVTPLDVKIDVGAMYFIGEIAEFYAQTTFKGVAVNATITDAVLYKPDGTTEDLTSQVVTTGLYKIVSTILGDETGTYTLVITANYVRGTIQANGTSFKCFLVSDILTLMNNKIMEIKDGLAMVQTDLGFVKLNLTAMNATLRNIFLRVIAIDGNTATIQTTLGVMNATITEIKGNFATIVIPGFDQIETDISSLKATQETSMIPQYVTLIIALIAAVTSTLSLIYIRRRKTTGIG